MRDFIKIFLYRLKKIIMHQYGMIIMLQPGTIYTQLYSSTATKVTTTQHDSSGKLSNQ
jgi:hypothetical protein